MKSILCFELKRCFGSKRLYLSLLTGIVISLLHIIFGVLPLTQWLSSWQGDFFLTPHSAYGHWIGMDSSTVWPTLLYMLLPFLCAFPFSDTVSWDFSTGYVMQIFVRRKKSAYLFAKALTIFICLRLFDSDNLVLRLCRHRLIFAACPAGSAYQPLRNQQSQPDGASVLS